MPDRWIPVAACSTLVVRNLSLANCLAQHFGVEECAKICLEYTQLRNESNVNAGKHPRVSDETLLLKQIRNQSNTPRWSWPHHVEFMYDMFYFLRHCTTAINLSYTGLSSLFFYLAHHPPPPSIPA